MQYSYTIVGCSHTQIVYRFMFEYKGNVFGLDFNCPRIVDMSKATSRNVDRFHVANCLLDFRRRRDTLLKSLAQADRDFRETQARARRSTFRIVE